MALQRLIKKLKLDRKGYVYQFEYYVNRLKPGAKYEILSDEDTRSFCYCRLQGILEGLYLVEYITQPEYLCLSEEVRDLFVDG